MGVTVKKCHRIMSLGMTAGTECVSVLKSRQRIGRRDIVIIYEIVIHVRRQSHT